jgi:hypothetical protein
MNGDPGGIFMLVTLQNGQTLAAELLLQTSTSRRRNKEDA